MCDAPTKDTDFISGSVVLHEELVTTTNVGIKIPVREIISSLLLGGGRHNNDAYQATASSAILAHHWNRGDTTPGWMYVPIPG